MRVSILIPHNEMRDTLKRAIESASLQTYTCEVIVYGSDKELWYNFNNALHQSTGKYIKILHDDDYLPLDSVENFIKHDKKADICISNAENRYKDGRKEVFKSSYTDLKSLAIHNTIHGGTVFYRRSKLIECQGMRDLKTGEEFDMHLRMIKAGATVEYMDFISCYYNIGDNKSLNHRGFKNMPERREYIKKQITNEYI